MIAQKALPKLNLGLPRVRKKCSARSGLAAFRALLNPYRTPGNRQGSKILIFFRGLRLTGLTLPTGAPPRGKARALGVHRAPSATPEVCKLMRRCVR